MHALYVVFHLVSFLLQLWVALGNQNNTKYSSPWLNGVAVRKQREVGCWDRPWICNQGEPPLGRVRRVCCRNRCLDVMSDINNCGICGFRCLFPLQCCRGLCVNTNVNPFHCGRCYNRCPFFTFCRYGMCGYDQPHPHPPRPPFPPHPPRPFPPEPPFPPHPHPPFPPEPPRPFPPHPHPPFPPRPPHDPPGGDEPPPMSQSL